MNKLLSAVLALWILAGCQTANHGSMPEEIVEFAETRVMLITDGERKGSGSGFILTNDIVVTACHVVNNTPNPVGYSDDYVSEFITVYCDEDSDIAILKWTGGMPINVEPMLVDDVLPRQGQLVYGAGYPLGLPLTITHGFWQRKIEETNRTEAYLISAPTINGDSGSPVLVLDDKGKVHIVGMRVAIRGMPLYGARMGFGSLQAPLTHIVLAVPSTLIFEAIKSGTEELP